jgi:hypothetical protein
MRPWLNKHFPAIDRNVDRFGYWYGFFAIVWAIMSGIVSTISAVSQYGFGVIVLGGLAIACALVLILSVALVSWRYFHPIPRHLAPFDPSAYSHDPAAGAPSREVYFSLLDFVIQYLWPACDAQIDLQKAIIKESKADDMIKELAIEGMPLDSRPNSLAFWIQYQNMVQGIEGSEPTLEFDALVECINRLANGAYKNFCELSGEMARRVTVNNPASHETLGPVWWRWAEKHNQLVDEHMKVRQNPRFGRKVYRPNRPANWGEKVAMEG